MSASPIVQWISVMAVLCLLLSGGGLAFFDAPSAQAAPALCKRLNAQLAATRGGGGNSAQYQKFARAADQQKRQISIARRQAAAQGCGQRRSSICRQLAGGIEQMRGNLAQLERRKAQYAGRNSKRQRARILAALKANNCQGAGKQGAENQGAGKKPKIRSARPPKDKSSAVPSVPANTFRTLCVRTCDGFYFPVSFSTTRDRFEADKATCQKMCPATETDLFFHAVPEEISEDMVSVSTGVPYTSIPNAFAYRDKAGVKDSACGCGANASVPGESETDETAKRMTAVPASKPQFGEDPETIDNVEGGLTLTQIKRIADGNSSPEEKRRVRVVGPAFFPDQSGEGDGPAPGRLSDP